MNLEKCSQESRKSWRKCIGCDESLKREEKKALVENDFEKRAAGSLVKFANLNFDNM